MKTNFETIDFLTCRKYLNDLGFSDAEITVTLNQLSINKRDLCDENGYKSEPIWPKIKEFSRKGVIHYKEYKGEYVKECTANGEYWFVPSQYQGLKHGKIIFTILSNRYNWFDMTKDDKKKVTEWQLYEMSSINYEMYLNTEFGSLYVPIKAIVEKDFSIIEKRMNDYFKFYYDYKTLKDYGLNHNGRTKEQYKADMLESFNKAIAPLQSKEAEIIKSNLL